MNQNVPTEKLPREEYIEQAYMFRALAHRMDSSEPVQILLANTKEEILATTKLPMAIDFLLAELNHTGSISSAMSRMKHYFAPFQTFIIAQTESEKSRLDMNMATRLLEAEARYRADEANAVGLFFYQFEILARNRLSYDYGLQAMAGDPLYNEAWRVWLLGIRQKIGIVDLSDLIYVHSEFYARKHSSDGERLPKDHSILFGEKEGRIALANRHKEPLYFFAALQRQLCYPQIPRLKRRDDNEVVLPKLVKTLERLEARVKFLEDEQRQQGIDLTQFFKKPQ